MSTPGGLSAGLAFLPSWLNDARDAHALDALLSGWVRNSGWRTAGLVWPADAAPGLTLQARPDGVERMPGPPPELPEVLKGLRGGAGTVVWQVPGTVGRLYCLLTPPGRPVGVVWAD